MALARTRRQPTLRIMPARQPLLFDDPAGLPPGLPEGLAYRPDFITPAEETQLIAALGDLPFEAYQHRGYSARRRVAYFGWRYYDAVGAVAKSREIPDFLLPLRDRCAAWAGVLPRRSAMC